LPIKLFASNAVNVNIYTIETIRPAMPAITASLSEQGYEGYLTIPKGMRSKVIDKMLRDYALDRHHITPRPGDLQRLTVRDVLDRQQYLEQTIRTLTDELKEARQ